MSQGGVESLWNILVTMQAEISKTGSVSASEVAQRYLDRPGAPPKQLRGFYKVALAIGESTTVNFGLPREDPSMWDTVQQSWVLQRGEHMVSVGQVREIYD